MTHHLKHHGYHVKQTHPGLMRLIIEAIYPQPKRSTINSEHRIYPYLLRDYQVIQGSGRLILPISQWIKGLCISWRYSTGIVVTLSLGSWNPIV